MSATQRATASFSWDTGMRIGRTLQRSEFTTEAQRIVDCQFPIAD
jgi:hypothetical protein